MATRFAAAPKSDVEAINNLADRVNGAHGTVYVTAALQSAAMTAAQVAGTVEEGEVNFDNTGTTPGNLATPTAALIIAARPNWQVGQSYRLNIRNSSGSANTATITAGTGVTLTGTMTIAQTVTRSFVVTYTAAGAVTFQSVGISAAGA